MKPLNKPSGTFSSLELMEYRINDLIKRSLGKDEIIHPFDMPLIMSVARKAISEYGTDDAAVINAIIMFRAGMDNAKMNVRAAANFFN